MNWILIVVIVLLAEKDINHMKLIFGLANPLPILGPAQIINPYILHWEAANFDRITLENAHQYHLGEKNRRRKRDLKKEEYGPAHTIKLKFTAHDREFRLILHQDPLSVFTPDAEIENTLGPVDYDISRIYTGSLEDISLITTSGQNFEVFDNNTTVLMDISNASGISYETHTTTTVSSRTQNDSVKNNIEGKNKRIKNKNDENSHIHAVLTTDNLIDGTISTNYEQYYIEPSNRYSKDLEKNLGIHTIVYKLSDVKMDKSISPTIWLSTNSAEHCASEKLRKKLLLQKNDYKRRKKSKSLKNINNTESISHIMNDVSDISNNSKKVTINSNKDNRNLKNINSSVGDNLVEEIIKNSYDKDTFNDNNVNVSLEHHRYKRWLPDELSDNRDPPLPLDLDVPYNDDYSVYNSNINKDGINNNNNNNKRSGNDHRSDSSTNSYKPLNNNFGHTISSSNSNSDIISGNGIYTKNGINRNRNILINQYNPSDINNENSDLNYNININGRNNLFTSYNGNNNNRNIIVNSYNNSINKNYRNIFNTNLNNSNTDINSNNNNINNSRPSHKTHVEILTKNGATKKPNIIVNNYNPDITHTNNNNNNNNNIDQINNFINHMNNHLSLNIRNELMDSVQSTTTSNIHHNTNNNVKSLYDRKSTCMLYLQADHTFFQKMGSDEASIEAITRHVQRANSIYKNTDFNGDGKPDNITFMIKRIKVHNSNALKDPTYRFPGNYGVEKFLELFSEEDYDAFCLAYMFTYRDFEMGTLGLAWTGDLKNAGGVCEKNGHYRGSLKSLNTGIVTLLNYGKHVPPAVSHVTLAHEIGHNFGSPHDPEQCTPGGEDGNYIMFARATSGDKRNNNKFSPCSLKSIEPVLNAKARSAKGCFTEPQRSICGNGVVEPGEQCDCGWEEDCKDDCCFPMSRHPRPDEKPCTLLPRAICSPSQGPCCTNQCSLKFGDKCRDDNGCRDPSFCDGRMPHCPPSVNKPNKTICNKEFVCFMGECTGSICLAYGLESCQCLPGPTDPKTKSCELCCKEPGEGKNCKSSFEWNEPPFDVPDMFAKPGTPCNDYNGYCDVFQKCREVDPSGPLATLRKLLLSEESIASFKKWIQSNWYTVVLAAIGVVILLVLSTKLLGKRNVKLKSVTIIHSATTETVRLPEDNNGVIVHTAVRTKVPFKKKVRGQRSTKPSTKIITKKSTKQIIKSGNGGSGGNNNGHATVITNNGITQGSNTTTIIIPKTSKKRSNSSDVLKKVSRKKNRVSSPTDENNIKILKKPKKSKKHKEIIDYSKTPSGTSTINPTNHTNTFGKVQKWLLDSPIVSQPLSHIEHSSKVRKVISKSQSTPERLVQKSPQKTKSVGNLSNEKVKLQVVYKPPFKFSLKLSKNSAVKTHVIGGALNKSKRKIRSGDKKRSGGAVGPLPITTTAVTGPSGAIGKILNSNAGERGRRTALLLRTNNEDDNQHLVNLVENSEPNYETLNSKISDKNPLYENMNMNNTAICDDNSIDNSNNEPKPSTSKPASLDAFRINRSASNSHIENTDIHRKSSKNNGNNRYNRSNSISHNPFNNLSSSSTKQSLRKTSDNSMNRNFGSTQNLISSGNLTKSKKRSSLNLKTSLNSNSNSFRNSTSGTKRSNSNLNLKRENSTSNINHDIDNGSGSGGGINSSTNLMKTTSSAINRVASINNIPRASLSTGHRTPTPPHMILTRQHSAINPSNINNINLVNNQINNSYNHNNSNNSSSGNSSSNSFRNSKNIIRPHTAACDDTRQFEWPTKLIANNNTNNTISNITKPTIQTNNIANPISATINSSSTTNTNNLTTTTNDQITHNNKNYNNKFNLSNKIINRNLSKNEEESLLPLNLEVMVSDIENLVS